MMIIPREEKLVRLYIQVDGVHENGKAVCNMRVYLLGVHVAHSIKRLITPRLTLRFCYGQHRKLWLPTS
jgi:hypothetical protein